MTTDEIKPDKSLTIGSVADELKALDLLQTMAKGQILEIFVGYPLTQERLLRNAVYRGHKVLKIVRISGPDHKLFIEAKGG